MHEDTPTHAEKRILLHACCGPCSMEPVRLLTEQGVRPTIYFSNPNIDTADEHDRRLDTLRVFAADAGVDAVADPYEPERWEACAGKVGDAARERFGLIADEHAAAFADKKEAERMRGGKLPEWDAWIGDEERKAALETALDEAGRPSLGNASPEARSARAARCRACYRVRLEAAAAYAAAHGFEALGTTLTVSPYQHTEIIREELERAAARAGVRAAFADYRPYYDEATRRSREAGMYRQNYCGCRFSKEEAEAERAVRKAERKARKRLQRLAKERAAQQGEIHK